MEEGVAARPLDIDLVWIHGYDFPVYRGGPLFHADRLGLGRIHQAILGFQARLGPECWVPAPLLERLANEGRGFYGTTEHAPAPDHTMETSRTNLERLFAPTSVAVVGASISRQSRLSSHVALGSFWAMYFR